MDRAQRRVRIRGRVQGVYFRADTRRLAEELGLVGWVRNRYDGSVEAVIQGERDRVDELLAWCHEGPPGAWVSGVEVAEEPLETFHAFSLRPTE